jgi:hypothetical protein
MKKDGSRMSLSSDVCGSCHGEPTRHGRYQQWQLSAHADYTTAVAEGTDPTCAKCHSAQGFVAWKDSSFSTANLTVDWTKDDVHPQTCATCHKLENVGKQVGPDLLSALRNKTSEQLLLLAPGSNRLQRKNGAAG